MSEMPTAGAITRVLATMAHDLVWLAIIWHLAVAAALLALLRGWRPTSHLAGNLLIPPILSVAVASLAYGNVFNALSFLLLAGGVAIGVRGLPRRAVARGPAWSVWTGIALIGFGLTYPHFVEGPWYRTLAAAPIGIVPCPTLALVAGAVMLAGGFGSRGVPAVVAAWTAFYAAFGVGVLGVTLDLGLVVAVLGLLALAITSGLRSAEGRGGRRYPARSLPAS